MLYLYAIVGQGPSLGGARGVFGEPLYTIPSAGLFAVVGDADGPPEKTRDRLVAHHEVVTRLSTTQAALPARFGQLVEERAIIADLNSRASSLVEALSLVEGCVQMTLRIGVDGSTGKGALDIEDLDPTALARAPLDAPLPQPVEALRRALSSAVRAEKVKVHPGAQRFASLYHLVPRALVDDWCVALDKERMRTGATIVATGPWPAYAFALAA